MTSRIIVNNIQSDAGISTIFFNSDIGGTGGTLNVDGNLNVGGVVTYDDVTNIDSVGVITARSGLHVTGGNVGIGTDNPTQKLVVKGVSSLVATNSTNAWMPYTYTDNSFRLNYNGAGDDEVTVTSGGNMSLGTSTGLNFSLLDGLVVNTSNGSAGLLINSSSSSHNAYLGFSYGSGSSTSHADQFSAYIGRVGDNKLILGTNNTIRLNIDSSGRVGIQGDPTRALLEVRASGGSNTMLTALWGANEGTVTGALSDNTDKAVRMGIQHYDTDALPYAFLVGSSTSSANNLTFGGGTSLMNAATEIVFRTASNTTTATGTERLRINSAGQMILGTASNLGSVPPKLTIVNNTNSSTFSECQLLRLNGPSGVGERGGIGFHYAQSSDYGEKPSAFIGHETVSAGGAQQSDLIFATRSNTNDVEPTERVRITSGGLVQIATSTTSNFPDRLLSVGHHTRDSSYIDIRSDVVGGILFADGTSGDAAYRGQVDYNHNDDEMRLWTAATVRMKVSSAGRIRFPNVPGVAGSNLSTVYIESDGNLCTTTSVRAAKTNISPLDDTSWLYNLNPVTFNWRTKTENEDGTFNWGEEADGGIQYGLIAEEVKEVKDDFCYYNNDGVLTGIHYDRLIAPLLKVVQQQKEEIETLEARITALEGS